MTSTNTSNDQMRIVDGGLTRLSRAVGAYTRVNSLMIDLAAITNVQNESWYELTVASEACRLNLAQVITDLRAAWLACFPPPATTIQDPQ